MKTNVLYSNSPNASTIFLRHSMPEKLNFECPWRKLYKDVILIHYQSFWLVLSNQHTEWIWRTQMICHGKKGQFRLQLLGLSGCLFFAANQTSWMRFANELRPLSDQKGRFFCRCNCSIFRIPWPCRERTQGMHYKPGGYMALRPRFFAGWMTCASTRHCLQVPPDSAASGNRRRSYVGNIASEHRPVPRTKWFCWSSPPTPPTDFKLRFTRHRKAWSAWSGRFTQQSSMLPLSQHRHHLFDLQCRTVLVHHSAGSESAKWLANQGIDDESWLAIRNTIQKVNKRNLLLPMSREN